MSGLFTETAVKTIDDIFWHKKEFDSGKINLCFITGYSGSGKSSMGKDYQGKWLIHPVDMDTIVMEFDKNYDKHMNSKDKFIKSFMKDEGHKFSKDERSGYIITGASGGLDTAMQRDITRSLLNYAIKYTSSHKFEKVIMEGVWVYRYIQPSELDSYAVYIKGTSMLTSAKRASLRNAKPSGRNSTYSEPGAEKPNMAKAAGFMIGKTGIGLYEVVSQRLEKFQRYYMGKIKNIEGVSNEDKKSLEKDIDKNIKDAKKIAKHDKKEIKKDLKEDTKAAKKEMKKDMKETRKELKRQYKENKKELKDKLKQDLGKTVKESVASNKISLDEAAFLLDCLK